MGMPYALIKADKPEVFNLGKGGHAPHGWPGVFKRSYGLPFGIGSNFDQSFSGLNYGELVERINKFDNGYTGDAKEIASRIIDWMGDSECFLINYWEEIEEAREIRDNPDPDCDEPFSIEDFNNDYTEITSKLCCHLLDHHETGNVWNELIVDDTVEDQ